MSAHASTIEPLVEELAMFVGDRGCKLLSVRVGIELRRAAVDLVLAHEHRPDNCSPFVVLEHDHTARAPGWLARADHARAQHEQRREGAEPPIPELPSAPGASDERVGFALQLHQLLAAAPAHTEGLVVVLAPAVLEAPERWREAVEMFVAGRELADVRWIVVEAETRTLDELAVSLAGAARRVDVRVSSDAAIAELEQLSSGSTTPGPKGITPPSRKDVAGPSDAAGEQRAQLGGLVLCAALAASRSRSVEAIAAQRRARDVCESAGWFDEAIAMELVLGGYLVGAGAVRDAESSFLRAIEGARKHERPDKIATAGFGLGAARTIRGERHTALVAYAEAALAAEDSKSTLLAIEGSRLAGQAAADLGMEPQAITFFGRAVRLAEESTEDVSRTSAAIAARSLAVVCRRRRMSELASELEEQARRFASPDRVPTGDVVHEAPEPRVAVVPEAPERTSVLTLEEMARMHWGGVADDPSPPSEGSRSWTHDEIRSLQLAVDHSLDDRTSQILSRRELLALHGDSVQDVPPAVLTEREPESLEPEPLEPAPLADVEVAAHADEMAAFERALARMLAFGEGRIIMRRDELELIRKHLGPGQQGASADDDDTEDAG